MIFDNSSEKKEYYKIKRRSVLFIIISAILTAIVFVLTFGMSTYDMTISESWDILMQHLFGDGIIYDETGDYVIWEKLFPRSIGTIFVGGGLAVAGAVMQNLMRNPLADSYTTGISSGAGLGATLFLVFGICVIPGVEGLTGLIINAFIMSLIPAFVMIVFSMKKRATPSEIILIGVGVMYFFSAFTTIMMLMAEPDNLSGAYMWNLGNMGGSDWESLGFIMAGSIAGTVVLSTLYRKLNIVALGDKTAMSFGEDAFKLRRFGLIVVSLMVAMIVCFTGTIGFVGLVAPHIVRMFIGSDMKHLLPASFFFGALLMLLCDTVAKMLILPIGVITSIIGGPLFLFILVKMRKNEGF